MSRIQATLQALQSARRKALIPYITTGDPFADGTPEVMHALVAGGADILELGVPFSDPMADGPVIQQASERALSRGIGSKQVLQAVREFRQRDTRTPVVLMGYANPIERYDGLHGSGAFIAAASEAGVDGLLVVDYPPEECELFAQRLQAADMDAIFLLAPTSTEQRMREVGRIASGYVYYVSLKGVTGAGHLDPADVARKLGQIRRHVALPVGVGFGIRDAVSAQAVAAHADAVVIGSRIIQEIEAGPAADAASRAGAWLGTIRHALDAMPGKPAR